MSEQPADAEVVEGPTTGPPAAAGIVPLVVEPDRVVLGVTTDGDPASARLLTFRDDRTTNSPWVAHDLDELDAHHGRAGRVLLSRCEDRSGHPFTETSPWHVSEYGPPSEPPT